MNIMRSRKCEICGRKTSNDGNMWNFPMDEERCREWVKYVGNEDLAYIPIERLRTLKQVCSYHFLPSDYDEHTHKLKSCAVPSLALTREPLPDEVFANFPYHLVDPVEEPSDASVSVPFSTVAEHDYIIRFNSDGSDIVMENVSSADNISDIPDANEEDTQNEVLPRHLVNQWSSTLGEGLPPDMKNRIMKKFCMPSNCLLLQAPTLNERITSALEKLAKTQDQQMTTNQDQLGLGIAAIGKVLTLLHKDEIVNKFEITEMLCDACHILTDLHYMMTQTRLCLLTNNEILFSIQK